MANSGKSPKKTRNLKKVPTANKPSVETLRKKGVTVKQNTPKEKKEKQVPPSSVSVKKKTSSSVKKKAPETKIPKNKNVPKEKTEKDLISITKKEKDFSVQKKEKVIKKEEASPKKKAPAKIIESAREDGPRLKDHSSEKKEKQVPHFEENRKDKKIKKNVPKKVLTMEELRARRMKKIFCWVLFFCITILAIEGIYILYQNYQSEQKNVYYDALTSVAVDREEVVSVGSSFFKYSKNNSYTDGIEKGKFVKYDQRGNLLFEKMYEQGNNSTFTSVLVLEDGYLVTGSAEYSKYQTDNQIRDALLIKYNKKGDKIWEKTYKVLSNSSFQKAILTSDGYIVVGQSIYENMEMGNHTTGGGIIVKYDFDGNVIWEANHGGNKSGILRDVVEAGDAYYAVGRDSKDTGILVKFSKNGKYQWHKNYSYTDSEGFMGIAYSHQGLYVVGSRKILSGTDEEKEKSDRVTNNTDAVFIKYDLNGNIVFQKRFGGSSYERYNAILSSGDYLYVVGHTTSQDSGLKVTTDTDEMTGIVAKYDLNGHIVRKDVFGGSNNDNLLAIATDNSNLYIAGYSNSKDGNLVTDFDNGKDYFGKYFKIDYRFRILQVE